jgi:hypothetical protein
MSMSESRDPTEGQGSAFVEPYDLEVEVIVAPGAQVLGGARAGDWFELRATPLPKISR